VHEHWVGPLSVIGQKTAGRDPNRGLKDRPGPSPAAVAMGAAGSVERQPDQRQGADTGERNQYKFHEGLRDHGLPFLDRGGRAGPTSFPRSTAQPAAGASS
jgi:hypothetical protein